MPRIAFSFLGFILLAGCNSQNAADSGQVTGDPTSIGDSERNQQLVTIEYEGGYPTAATAEAMFDEYDYQAATQFYIWGYAYLNGLGFDKGLAKMGGDKRSIYLFDKRIQPQHVIMTANAEVIYVLTRAIDLKDGPVVFEVPPRTRGHFFDIVMRAYVDAGDVGPDKGEGGKFLMVARDYDGEIPEGYFEVRSVHSDLLNYVGRSFPGTEGSVEAGVDHAKNFRLYPLSEAEAPPEQKFVLIGDRDFSQDWPRDAEAFEWLGEVFTMDRAPAAGAAQHGQHASAWIAIRESIYSG